VDWSKDDNFILVGGEKLNRGFTVTGLIVTYMPRGPGGNNADTIQQRARFFGYKQSVLPIMRLWLDADVHESFRHYVEHERDLRSQLARFEGRPLADWKRAFLLEDGMKPTRRNVLLTAGEHFGSEEWFEMQPHPANFDELDRLSTRFIFSTEKDEFGAHGVTRVPLKAFVESTLVALSAQLPQQRQWYATMVGLLAAADDTAEVLLLEMRRNKAVSTRSGESLRVMQGKSGGSGPNGYPGDKKFFAAKAVTVQVHRFEVDGTPLVTICVRLPESLRRSVYVQ
jgi:hypothetical protein